MQTAEIKQSQPILLTSPFAGPTNFWSLSLIELEERMIAWGQPAYRARQIFQWAYKEMAADFASMANLPKELRARLAEEFSLTTITPARDLISSDRQTYKALLRLHDGDVIESVLMLYEDRATVCVSSQVGCAVGCPFCATGQMGLVRNLTAGEIVEQVVYFNRYLRTWQQQPDERLRVPTNVGGVNNIVFMGMGEPLANYKNLWRAIRNLNSPSGMGLGARRLTVSTSGLVPKIEQFTAEPEEVNLAISLHAANDELRSQMVPINKRYPLAQLMAACRAYMDKTHRRLSYEYALIEGVNDAPEQAEELARLLRGQLCHVNLIPLNPVKDTGFERSTRDRIRRFQDGLTYYNIPNTVRSEKGADIQAACGQLKAEQQGLTEKVEGAVAGDEQVGELL